jgi:hypothetical protein
MVSAATTFRRDDYSEQSHHLPMSLRFSSIDDSFFYGASFLVFDHYPQLACRNCFFLLILCV